MSDTVISNIPRAYTALAEWLACAVYIGQCPRRLNGWKLYLAAGTALALQCLWLTATGSLSIVFWIPCMAAAVGMMFLLIHVCTDLPLPSAGYYTIRAFLLAEFAASLEWQLSTYATYDLAMEHAAVPPLVLLLVYGAVFTLFFCLERRWNDPAFLCSLQGGDLWPPLMIGLICFFISNLSFVYSHTPFSSSTLLEIFNIRTLVDLSGVMMLYAYHAQSGKLYLKKELDAIKNVLDRQYTQYKQSRESIDVINRKYHDLKHQIAVLRAEQDSGRRTAFLDGMEQEIKAYEAQNKTDNSVLDTVLTSKSLYCARHQIELVCVADGALLNFMDVMDICTIFGNALDNAIEYELTVPDKEKRLIRMNVLAQKGFLVIRVENYFDGVLQLNGGIPSTTKQDQDYHGFGIKSIRYTAEKYGGSMKLSTQENWFRLNLLIPLPTG